MRKETEKTIKIGKSGGGGKKGKIYEKNQSDRSGDKREEMVTEVHLGV